MAIQASIFRASRRAHQGAPKSGEHPAAVFESLLAPPLFFCT